MIALFCTVFFGAWVFYKAVGYVIEHVDSFLERREQQYEDDMRDWLGGGR